MNKKKIIVLVELEVDAEEWAVAYGIEGSEVAEDVRSTILTYKESDSVFAGAEDAPIKVRKVVSVK